MASDLELRRFVPQRWEALEALLMASGFDLDPSPRDPNEWRADPPLGLVRVKALWVPRADADPDADADGRVSIQLTERWSTHPVPRALSARGLWLAAYSYNGHIKGSNLRYDFDPEGHPESPSHRHPFNAPEKTRKPCDQVTPATVVKELLAVVSEQVDSGQLVPRARPRRRPAGSSGGA
jgi:hypothetical protein